MNDIDIYQKLVEHDEETYQLIIESYSKLLWAVALSILGSNQAFNTMDIEEIVSDVFIRLWREPQKYDPEKGTLKNYLAVMTKSLALNRYKQNKRLKTMELYESLENELTNDEDWEYLYGAIQLLEEPYKEIIIRRFLFSENPKTIRKRMNLSVKQLDNYLYRGKNKLKQILLNQQKTGEIENETKIK